MEKNFLFVINTSLDDLVGAIKRLRECCESNRVKPFDKLDFYDLFYLIHMHKDVTQIPDDLIKFIYEYAVQYEYELIEEIEEDGLGDAFESSIFIGREFFLLSIFYLGTVSQNREYWESTLVSIAEYYPEIIEESGINKKRKKPVGKKLAKKLKKI